MAPPSLTGQPGPPEEEPPDPGRTGPAGRFAESARGWHGIQLAVLGFIGICGLLWGASDSAAPPWVRVVAGALAASAFVLALVAIYLVGGVAYPLRRRDPGSPAAGGPGTGGSGGRRLRTGVWLTYLAVALVVAATLSAWWPTDEVAGPVTVTDVAGRDWCGEVTESPAGTIRLDTAAGPVTVRLADVAAVRTVSAC